MVIDTHAHIIVAEITRDVQPDDHWRPQVRWQGAQQVIAFAEAEIRSALRECVHIEGILEAQVAAGIDRIVLSSWTSLLRYDAEAHEGLRVSRIQNEALAKLVHAHPTRVSALGTVPLQDPVLAARELQTAMDEMGLSGVVIGTSAQGVSLGDDRVRPFWEVAEATGALVFIHPTTRGLGVPALQRYYLWNAVGNPLETTVAAADLIMAGIMESYPELKVLLAHGGGALVALRGRLRHAYATQHEARDRLHASPEHSLERFYFDSLTHDPVILQNLIDAVGAGHVLLGSDYPFDMGVSDPAAWVRALGLSSEDEAKILGGNARRLLGIP